MRRLLYLALALVLLALTGLAFVRVTNSPAYVVRSLAARIEVEMLRQDVHQIIGRDPSRTLEEQSFDHKAVRFLRADIDCWSFDDDYLLFVRHAPESPKVVAVSVYKRSKATSLDAALEFLGLPKVDYESE
jgi:hypothetical protein